MHVLIEANKDKIIRLCRTHRIKNLYAFGSAVRGDFNGQSDVDFLYEVDLANFPGWADGAYDYTDNLSSFERGLENVLQRKIDLIPHLFIGNKYMRASIEKSKELIYAG